MSLPEIFKNEISEDIRNSQYTYYGSYDNRSTNIYDSLPVTVRIETKTKKFEATIIAKTENHIITSNNNVIRIDEIISINKL